MGNAEFPVGDTGSDCAVGRQHPSNSDFWFCQRLDVVPSLCIGRSQMNRKNLFVGILAAGCFITASVAAPSVGHAQADPRITKSMETLKAMTAKLGAPKLQGSEAVGGKEAPALHFGTTKINNNFDVVDAVGKEDGKGMTATLFAKGGDEYIRVTKARRQRPSGRYRSGRTGARV